MADLSVDARRVVDELISARRAAGMSPGSWSPSASFEGVLIEATQPLVHENQHLEWMHRNWDLASLLAPPPARGVKGIVRRVMHRLVMAVLAPYFARLQDYLGVNVRAVDAVSKRVDQIGTNQLRLIGAVRHDMIDFAHNIDKRLDG
jgi:hypothetical protein